MSGVGGGRTVVGVGRTRVDVTVGGVAGVGVAVGTGAFVGIVVGIVVGISVGIGVGVGRTRNVRSRGRSAGPPRNSTVSFA